MQSAIEKAIQIVGGESALARAVGTSQSNVWYWAKRAKRGVPGEYVLAIEDATGGRVTRHELRPDIYPPPPPALTFEVVAQC